jgi:phage FluMu protein gp41
VRHPDQDREEAGDFDLADSKAAQTVMRAVTAYPLNDAQLERIVKLALGKRVLEVSTATAGRDLPRVTTSAVGTIGGLQARPELVGDNFLPRKGYACALVQPLF